MAHCIAHPSSLRLQWLLSAIKLDFPLSRTTMVILSFYAIMICMDLEDCCPKMLDLKDRNVESVCQKITGKLQVELERRGQ